MIKNIHLLIFALILPVGFHLMGFPLWAVVCLSGFIWTGFVAFNVVKIRYTLFMKSVCRIKTKEKVVFLTFDDGPNPETTEKILSILESHQIKATFFCIGDNVTTNAHLARKIDSLGHLIGNHTQSHNWSDTFKNTNEYETLVNNCSEAVNKATGKKPVLFRPPYGITNPSIAKAIKKLHLTSIGWNIRSFDTIIKDENKILARIITRLKPGSIILLHDSMPVTVILLPKLIQQIHANGYKILSLHKSLL